jgi:hypothetical protein
MTASSEPAASDATTSADGDTGEVVDGPDLAVDEEILVRPRHDIQHLLTVTRVGGIDFRPNDLVQQTQLVEGLD